MDDRGRLYLIRAGVTLAALAVYARAVGFGFIGLDDPAYVTDNPHVLQGLTLDGIVWAFGTTHASNWHPLTWLSLMLDATLGGGRTWAFHLSGVLLHVANTLLLLELLQRATRRPWPSGFVALVFAVHPLHVESVVWISERKDVLCTFFWLLAMLAWLGYARSRSVGRYLLVMLGFALALMAKPMPVTLPFLLLLLDYWPLERSRRWGFLILEKLPLFALSAASGAITVYAQASGGAIGNLEYFSLGSRLGNAALSYVLYIRSLFWPVDLAVPYPFRVDLLTASRVSVALVLLVLATLACLLGARRRPYLAVGWLWYGVTLLPVIGLVQVGGQAMADRYMYVPMIGLLVIVAWGVPDLLRVAPGGARRLPLAALAAAVSVLLIAAAWRQVGYWRDTTTLFHHTLSVTEDNLMAHYVLAVEAHERGEVQQALEHQTEALRIWPGFVNARTERAAVLRMAGRPGEAVTDYREALRLRPGDRRILDGLEDALIEAGRNGEAIELLQERLKDDPDGWALHGRLAALFAVEGGNDEALHHFEMALSGNPADVPSRLKLATVLLEAGRLDESAAHFERVLDLDPDNKSAHKNLGVLLARRGDLEGAIDHFSEALRIDPADEAARQNLERARAMKRSPPP
jgi:tetratricopeptide (TPR) repeat protein